MYFGIVNVLMLVLAGGLAQGTNISLLSVASSRFSQKLYQNVAVGEDDIVYSPYSIHSSLALSYYGARGTTAAQMAETLNVATFDSFHLHHVYRELLSQMAHVENVTLYTGNAIFLNPRCHINPDFVREAKEDYFSKASNFDLAASGGPEKDINDFVARMTKNMISNILPKGTITSNTAMAFVNTLFFNGTWATQFKRDNTHKRDFKQLHGTTIQVEMMSGNVYVGLKKDDLRAVDVVQIPFVNTRFGFYIVLPRKDDGIVKLENLMKSSSYIDGLFIGLETTKVSLKVPKFKIETSLYLKPTLRNMGMEDAFDPLRADFTGISKMGIFINDVIHKAVIDVQESGTVASAATVVLISSKSLQFPPDESIVADHPFVFFLRDDTTQQILFQGKFSGNTVS